MHFGLSRGIVVGLRRKAMLPSLSLRRLYAGGNQYAGIAPGYREAQSGYTNDAHCLDVARVLLRGAKAMLAGQTG
jgi:hypothetical protein